MLCPVDCGACGEPECRVEGCKLTGEPMLHVCYLCGEIVTHPLRVFACVRCVEDAGRPGAA
jgi:hypothetical protein